MSESIASFTMALIVAILMMTASYQVAIDTGESKWIRTVFVFVFFCSFGATVLLAGYLGLFFSF